MEVPMKFDSPNRLFIERKYVSFMSIHLPKYTHDNSSDLSNFRCIVCGDSKKNPNKKRGFIYFKKDKQRYNYTCHNCGYSNSFVFFLKEYIPSVFAQYKEEIIEDIFSHNEIKKENIITSIPRPVQKITERKIESVIDLGYSHHAYKYCVDRQIPLDKLKFIKHCNNFNSFVKQYMPTDTMKLPTDERILFELRDLDNKIFGVQGRIIVKDGLRFVTIKFIEDMPKIYGMERINTKQTIVVTEGIIDSLFLDNSLALCGGDPFQNLAEMLKVEKSNIIMALDNEPRSADTIKRMEKCIDFGYKVCIWKIDSKYKDINEMIKNGIQLSSIKDNIYNHSFNGFEAKMKLGKWKKI